MAAACEPMALEDPSAKAAHSAVEDAAADTTERFWIAGMSALVVLQLWFGMIATSLWRDETGTWWAVKDSLSDAAQRSFYWGGTSPLYFGLVWAVTRIFGLNEISLRLLSLVAMSGAVYFLYRIAERLLDRSGARAVVLVFLCISPYFAIDARPYALAMLGLTSSTWAMLRWLDTRRAAYALMYILAATLVLYAHCVMALALAPAAVYAIAEARKQRVQFAWLAGFWIATALLSIPLVRQLQSYYAARAIHTVAETPTLKDFFESFLRINPAGVLILGLWMCVALRNQMEIRSKWSGPAALLIATWFLFPPLALFLLGEFTDVQLFGLRYYSSTLPGQALLFGGLVASIQHSRTRIALLAGLAAISILMQGRLTVQSHGGEDFRVLMPMIKEVAGSAPVLIPSSFIEASDFASLKDPKLRDVLFAPQLVYGEPQRTIRLPIAFDGADNEDMENVVRQLEGQPRFYLLKTELEQLTYEQWLLGRLGGKCKADSLPGRLTRFTCDARH